MDGPIEQRMARALERLEAQWGGRRRPKGFYLAPLDWDEFMAKPRRKITTMVGNNPPQARRDPVFKGVPVRQSTGKGLPGHSRLYDNTTTGRAI